MISNCVVSFFVVMERITVVSDPTNEFPHNTRSSFKVRLSPPLRFPGQWQVAMASFAASKHDRRKDEEQTSLTSTVKAVDSSFEYRTTLANIREAIRDRDESQDPVRDKPTLFRFIFYVRNISDTTLKWIDMKEQIDGPDMTEMNSASRYSGKEFLTILLNRLHDHINYQVGAGMIDTHQIPTWHWEGDTLVFERKQQEDIDPQGVWAVEEQFPHIVSIWLPLKLCVGLNWVYEYQPKKLMLMGNCHYIYEDNGYRRRGPNGEDGSQLEFDPGTGTYYEKNLRQAYFPIKVAQPIVFANDDNNGYFVLFSQLMEWRFENINSAFEGMMKEYETSQAAAAPKKDVSWPSHDHSILVYSNLVSPNRIGASNADLLRLVPVFSTNSLLHFEPKHLQWLPLSKKQVDVIEIQVAKVSGELVQMDVGAKTVVTFALRKVADDA